MQTIMTNIVNYVFWLEDTPWDMAWGNMKIAPDTNIF